MRIKFTYCLNGLLAAALLTVAGCGGGGGSGGDGGVGEIQTPVTDTTFDSVDLQGFDGRFSVGLAINADGLAVGFAEDGDGIKGARWTVTTAASSPASALEPLTGNNLSAAYGVNAAGIAVGESESGAETADAEDDRTVAVFWPAGSANATPLSTLGLLPAGSSAALAINDGGSIVGEAADNAAGDTVAVYWAGISAQPLILDHLSAGDGSFSSASFIGADGAIVGESRNAAGQVQAVIWSPSPAGGFQAPTALVALAPGQIASAAFGADPNGRIVGEAELAGGVAHGVVWNADGSLASDLGAHTSAQAINGTGRIVGYSEALTGNDSAAIWNGELLGDYKNLDAPFSQAYGVNDSSQIVGFSGNQGRATTPR